MSLTRKTVRAGVWQLVSIIVRIVAQLGVIAVLARHISPKEFGLIALANMVLIFVEMFAEAGIGPAIIQKKDLRPEDVRVGFTLAVILGTLFVAILWLVAPLVAGFFEAESLVDIIRWLGLSILIIKFGMIGRSLIERDMRFDILMFVDVGSYVVGYAGVGITLAVLGYGVWAIVAGKLTQCCLQSICLYALRPHPVRPVFSIEEYKKIATYGGGLTICRFFDNISSRGDYFIVGRFCGVDLLGFYDRAASIMGMPGQYLGYVLDKVLFPAMSQIQDESARLENAYSMSIGIVNLILFPMSVFMFIIAPELVLVLLGPKWTNIVVPLRILLVTLNLRICVNLSDTLVRAVGAVYASAIRKVVFAFLIIFGSWIGHYWGIAGVAVAVDIAFVINYGLMIRLSIKLVKGGLGNYIQRAKNGYIIGGILLAVSFVSCSILRLYVDSAILILCGTTICSGLFVLLIVFLFPGILGEPGVWLFRQIAAILRWKHRVPGRLTT